MTKFRTLALVVLPVLALAACGPSTQNERANADAAAARQTAEQSSARLARIEQMLSQKTREVETANQVSTVEEEASRRIQQRMGYQE